MTEIERIRANIVDMRDDQQEGVDRLKSQYAKMGPDNIRLYGPGIKQQIAESEHFIQAYNNCLRIIDGGKYCC